VCACLLHLNSLLPGKGEIKTYFLLGMKGSLMQLTPPDASEMNPASNMGTPPMMDYGSSGAYSPMPFQNSYSPMPGSINASCSQYPCLSTLSF